MEQEIKAMTEQLESLIPDTEIRDVCEELHVTVEAAFNLLIQRRDTALAAANEPLDAEKSALKEESAAIATAAENLKALLPAQAREAQRQADALLLDGKHEAAQAKIAEQHEAEAAPETMRTRQQAITARLSAIEGEKRDIARRVFAQWYAELQTVIRPVETGLFVRLLDSGLAEMRAFQEKHGLVGTLADPYAFLVKDSHIAQLTAPERSEEWQAGNRWYRGGRTR